LSITAERGVTGARQLGGRLDQALQQAVERELRAERDAGVHEAAQAIESGAGRHGAIVTRRATP
jgi:hypothetical protein